jgi:starch-binding outer membrane protein, SusD/RagB family
MKNKHANIWILLAIGSLLGACKKQLDVFPTTSEVDGNAITDQQSAQTVLNGVYYRFADAGLDEHPNVPLPVSAPYSIATQSTLWTDVNEVLPSELSGSSNLFDPDSINGFTFNPGTTNVNYIWQYGYALVSAANGFIKNATSVATIPATAKQQMLAEAKFLRAFGNSELLLYYGQYNDPSSPYGIILRDTFATTADIQLPRSTVAAAYTSILSDLDAAIEGLPILNTAIYYANASDAKLLEARLLMNRGATGDYARVIDLTKDIIANGPFALEDSLKDIFLTKGFNSPEVMLGVQPYSSESYKFQNYVSVKEYVGTDSLASLLANDARSQWVYATILDLYGIQKMVTKYYSGDPTNPAQTPLSTYCYAFRLTEAYLLEAEAITLSTGDLPSAKTLLTTVMSHAGAGAQEMAAVANAVTPAALQLEIVKENMRNFACENGVDWFALRRLPFATLQSLNPNIKDAHQLIFPIPTAELDQNNVIQNPGY